MEKSSFDVIVAICTFNRNNLLQRLLDSLANIQMPRKSMALIIINNQRDEQTRSICTAADQKLPFPVHYIEEPIRGISFARNRALREAQRRGAEMVAFIDDDDMPEPDWLCQLLERQEQATADIVVGSRRYAIPATASSVARERLWERELDDSSPLWNEFGLPFRQSTCNVLIGTAILDVLAAEGPIFDPRLALSGGEDSDFFCRARRAGARFSRAIRSIVNQTVREETATVPGLMRRRFFYGVTHGVLAKRYMEHTQLRAWRRHVSRHMAIATLQLPISLASWPRLGKRLIKLAWAAGCWWGYFGGRYEYYARPQS